MGVELTGKAGDNGNVRLAIRAGAVAGESHALGLAPELLIWLLHYRVIFGKEPSVKHL